MPTNIQFGATIVQPPTNQEATIYADARQQIGPFSVGLLVGLSLGYFGHRLACKRDAKNRLKAAKDPFGIVIQCQLRAIPDRGVIEFYKSSKPAIGNAVSILWHFLPVKDRASLDELWNKYDKELSQQFDPQEDTIGVSASQNLHGKAHIKEPFESNHARIKRYLNEFYKFAE